MRIGLFWETKKVEQESFHDHIVEGLLLGENDWKSWENGNRSSSKCWWS